MPRLLKNWTLGVVALFTPISAASAEEPVTITLLCDSKFVDTSMADNFAPRTKTGTKRKAHRFELNGANFSTYNAANGTWLPVGASRIEIDHRRYTFSYSFYETTQYDGRPRLRYVEWSAIYDLGWGDYSYQEKIVLLANDVPPPGSVKGTTGTALRPPWTEELGAEHYMFTERRTGSCRRVSQDDLAAAFATKG